MLALLLVIYTLSGRGGGASGLFPPPDDQQPLRPRPPFACPLASQAERDGARLAFARNLTISKPWLLRPVSAASRDAQDMFSTGLLEAHGFNAAEAQAFAALALEASPRCAMCAWLSAYALGPTPNAVVDARGSRAAGFPVFGPEEAAQADAMAQKALELAIEEEKDKEGEAEEHDTKEQRRRQRILERRLIRALAERNRGAAALVSQATSGDPLPEPWRPRQEAYARELARVAGEAEAAATITLTADALALAAEAHLSLTPWDYYYYDEDVDQASPATTRPPRRLLLLRSFLRRRQTPESSSSTLPASASVPREGHRGLRLRPTAAQAEQLLQRALRLDPRHALALHLYVHVAEAGVPGPAPGAAAADPVAAWRGERAADALAALRLPQGHLLHMPSHVYVRVGRYRDAHDSNAAARGHDVGVAAQTRCAPAYVPEHNAQLASYAAAAAGMARAAVASALGARRLRASLPDVYVARGTEWTTVPLLRARFGDWRPVLLAEESELLTPAGKEELDALVRGPLLPPPSDARARTSAGGRGFATVIYHYVRLLALAARADAGDGADSAAQLALELRRLRRAARDQRALREPRTLPGGAPGLYASGNAFLAPIYERMGTARAELAQAARWRWRRGGRGRAGDEKAERLAAASERRALSAMQQAVELERALPYFEPPMLEQPASSCLGWLLLRLGKAQEAARVYRRELAEWHPENPWALTGLERALRSAGGGLEEEEEAKRVRERVERAWQHADADVRARFSGLGGGSTSSSSSCPQFSAAWR